MFYLAQDMPDSNMLQGDTQSILAWVVLAQIVLFMAVCTYFIMRQSKHETKYDKLQKKTMKIAIRSQRAIEVLADLPAPAIEEDLDDEEDD